MNKNMQSRIAVFPGSFDPPTLGHLDLIRRAAKLFDGLIVVVGYNANKKGMFEPVQRQKWLQMLLRDVPGVSVDLFSGLTVDYMHSKNISFMVRGLRNSSDFESETSLAFMNHTVYKNCETIYIQTAAEYRHVSSSLVRELIVHHGDVSPFVPQSVAEVIHSGYSSKKSGPSVSNTDDIRPSARGEDQNVC